MDAEAYLKRIKYHGPLLHSADCLRALHRAHMLNVPFENLDIPLGNKISISLPSFYEKIVTRRRGGFCYELNGLFGWLLEQLGFKVTLHSARVFKAGGIGQEFGHLVLQVHLLDDWLADVGFGELFLEPLRLTETAVQEQQGARFRISHGEEDRILSRRSPSSEWESQYAFTLVPRKLDEFSEMCEYHQTSPNSTFTQKHTCSLATSTGRITLSGMHLIITDMGVREERELDGINEYRRVLKDYFGVEVEGMEKIFSN